MRISDKASGQRSVARKDLLRLRECLVAMEGSSLARKAFVGFDGFIDKIQKAVEKTNGSNSVFFSSIREFSKHIESLAGRSGQIELVTSQTKAGGNGPILSAALGELNIETFCIGSMGTPEINPLFKNAMPKVELSSISAPGNSQALEFSDGKIIFSDLSSFAHYDWSYVKKNIDIEKIRNRVRECDVVALVDWSNLPYATDIWQGLLDDVFKVVHREDLCFLFDLCDPSKKSPMEIDEMLDLIGSFSIYGKATLAMNENEARRICMALTGCDQNISPSYFPTLFDIGSFIFSSTSIDTLLIHPVDRVLAFQKDNFIELRGRLVKEPKVQTGGGDNFNAGYCLGLAAELSFEECVLLAIVTSGAFVQNGKSSGIKDLISYLDNWANEIEMKNQPMKVNTGYGNNN